MISTWVMPVFELSGSCFGDHSFVKDQGFTGPLYHYPFARGSTHYHHQVHHLDLHQLSLFEPFQPFKKCYFVKLT